MKRILIFYLLFLSAFSAFGQDYPDLYPPKITPASPTSTDSIVFEIGVVFYNVAEKMEDTVIFRGDTIYISACYYEGVATRPTLFNEKFNLGPLPPGKYTIAFTAIRSHGINGCNPMDSNNLDTSFHVSFSASINADVEENFSVHITPNPTNKNQHIRFKIEKPEILEISLFDLTGRAIKKVHKGILPPGENSIPVDLSNLPSGVYLYKVLIGDQVEFVKVVKQ